jgi:hypothetical protein
MRLIRHIPRLAIAFGVSSAIASAMFYGLLTEALLNVLYHGPDFFHRLLQFFGADAESRAPVPTFKLLAHIDALSVLPAAFLRVVAHHTLLFPG